MKLITEESQDIHTLVEAHENGNKQYFIEGVFMSYDIKNNNGRIYTRDILLRESSRFTDQLISKSRAMGELGHPNGPSINLDRVSHVVTKLWEQDSHFYGRAKILDTPYGKIVKCLIDEGVKFGVSSRGIGSLEKKNGVDYVGQDYKLCTIDIVADPSAPEAFVNGILEGKEYMYIESGALIEKDAETYKKMIKDAETKQQLEEATIKAFSSFLNNLRTV